MCLCVQVCTLGKYHRLPGFPPNTPPSQSHWLWSNSVLKYLSSLHFFCLSPILATQMVYWQCYGVSLLTTDIKNQDKESPNGTGMNDLQIHVHGTQEVVQTPPPDLYWPSLTSPDLHQPMPIFPTLHNPTSETVQVLPQSQRLHQNLSHFLPNTQHFILPPKS